MTVKMFLSPCPLDAVSIDFISASRHPGASLRLTKTIFRHDLPITTRTQLTFDPYLNRLNSGIILLVSQF